MVVFTEVSRTSVTVTNSPINSQDHLPKKSYIILLPVTCMHFFNFSPTQGSVVIAAITSCTNTSNPSVMLGAGLLAKKAVELGLSVKPYVKTSLSPGSGVVTYYLQESGVVPSLEQLG